MNARELVTKEQVGELFDKLFAAGRDPDSRVNARDMLQKMEGITLPLGATVLKPEEVAIPRNTLARMRTLLAEMGSVTIRTKDDMTLEGFLRTQNGTKTMIANSILDQLATIE